MSALAANAAVAVAVLLCGISALLAVVGFLTYRRVGHGRLLWVAIAFAAFAIQGLVLARDFYVRRGELAQGWDALAWVALANLGIVLALYMAVLKR